MYIHDFLRLIIGADNVYINNVKYVADDDEYNIEWAETFDNVGKVRILMSEQTQDVKNVNCSGVEISCNLVPDFLLQENGGKLLLEDGSGILL